jgi:hypothetical protein
LKNRLTRQTLVPGLGAFMDSMFTAMPILSIANFVSIVVVLYTSIHPWLAEKYPFFDHLWMLYASIVVVSVVSLVLVYRYVLPSLWSWRKSQMEFRSEDSKKLDYIVGWIKRHDEKEEEKIGH